MNYAEFFREAEVKKININFDEDEGFVAHRLSNEALFHLPLLAMTILLLSKGQTKPRMNEIGQLMGECFERTFIGFKGSSQNLGWSANLRVRTVKALTFLESSQLVTVEGSDSRIKNTSLGRKIAERAISSTSDLAHNLRAIERNYRDINVEKKIRVDLF